MNHLFQHLRTALLIAFAASPLFAQELVTDRPDKTESASVVPVHRLQLEAGGLIDINRKVQSWTMPAVLLRYGITTSIELRLAAEGLAQRDSETATFQSGFSDLEPGVKIRLSESEFELAYLGHVIIPVGSKRLSNESFGIRNSLALAYPLSDNVDVGSNIIYDYLGAGRHDAGYTVVLGVGITEKISIFSEFFGGWSDLRMPWTTYDNGVTYLLQPNLQLDFSFGTGLQDRAFFLSAGVSWRIPH